MFALIVTCVVTAVGATVAIYTKLEDIRAAMHAHVIEDVKTHEEQSAEIKLQGARILKLEGRRNGRR
jgi:hypothetical protein